MDSVITAEYCEGFENQTTEINSNNIHPVHQFVSFVGNQYVCKVCDHNFPSTHTGNMRKHIERKHSSENKILQTALKSYYSRENNGKKSANTTRKRNRFAQPKSRQITVTYDVEDVRMAFTEMCNVNMWPYRQLRHSGLSRIVEPLIKESRKHGMALSNRPEAIELYSIQEQSRIKNIIKEELDGKLFSVMIDATTTQYRSILGISAQYMVGDQVVVRTLAMRRLKEDHTGINLSKVLKSVLNEYGTNPVMVYSMTTDNESSVVKCVRDTEVRINEFFE